MATNEQHRDWNELARLDPYWAVLSHPDKKFGRWRTDDFLASGHGEVAHILATGAAHGLPRRFETALDFGCGPGRLAPHVAQRFSHYEGVDISDEMVRRAQQLHQDLPQCRFTAHPDASLEQFPDGHFDLVVSLYVLQHVRSAQVVLHQLAELVRVLRPGGLLAVQLPASVPAAVRARHVVRREVYNRVRAAGVSEQFAFRRLRLSPMTMTPMAESRVTAHLEAHGAQLVTVERGTIGRRTDNRVYFATREGAT